MGYSSKPLYSKPSVLIGRKGSISKVRYIEQPFWTVDTLFYTKINEDIVYPRYLYYLLSLIDFSLYDEGTSIPSLRTETLNNVEIEVPSLDVQKKSLGILEAIDKKIENNTKLNDNLLQQVMTLYKDIFSKKKGKERNICRADEYFDISIGKTPPRKEFHWFSDNSNDIKWVSISDLGSCGVFISDSSEYLTKAAVDKFNIIVVPDNNVLLSFKLTVGRVAITDGCMATNEAIAHFKTENKDIIEYLYCYLKSFNFEVMGSTSSIATAVNSKIIKSMPFVVPADTELSDFHKFACPIFNAIKLNQRESRYLETLRDILLPKLISGEIELGC